MRSRDSRIPTSWIGPCAACVWLVASVGCMEGPFNGGGRLNPWINKEWAADDSFREPHYYVKRDRIEAQRSRAASMGPDEQRGLAADTLQKLQDEQSPVLRAKMVRLLGDLTRTDVIEGARAALQDSDPEVRVAACRVIARRGGEDAATELVEVVKNDQDVDVRIEAAKRLGDFKGSKKALEGLAAALDDDDSSLQFAAVRSLEAATGKHYGVNAGLWRRYLEGDDPPETARAWIGEDVRDMWWW